MKEERITWIQVKVKSWDLIGMGDPCEWQTVIKRNGMVCEKTLTFSIRQEGERMKKEILEEEKFQSDLPKTKELFQWIEEHLDEMCDPDTERIRGCDGCWVTVRFMHKNRKIAQTDGWCWEFPLGRELDKKINELTNMKSFE